jgi:hypothetical protein
MDAELNFLVYGTDMHCCVWPFVKCMTVLFWQVWILYLYWFAKL